MDLSRGGEDYKYKMGGKPHWNYTIELKLNGKSVKDNEENNTQ